MEQVGMNKGEAILHCGKREYRMGPVEIIYIRKIEKEVTKNQGHPKNSKKSNSFNRPLSKEELVPMTNNVFNC
jgi:hypothetical protein